MAKPKVFSSEPDHLRYNELLGYAQEEALYVQDLADRAFRLSQVEKFGPQKQLTKIAQAAVDFLNAIKLAKPL